MRPPRLLTPQNSGPDDIYGINYAGLTNLDHAQDYAPPFSTPGPNSCSSVAALPMSQAKTPHLKQPRLMESRRAKSLGAISCTQSLSHVPTPPKLCGDPGSDESLGFETICDFTTDESLSDPPHEGAYTYHQDPFSTPGPGYYTSTAAHLYPSNADISVSETENQVHDIDAIDFEWKPFIRTGPSACDPTEFNDIVEAESHLPLSQPVIKLTESCPMLAPGSALPGRHFPDIFRFALPGYDDGNDPSRADNGNHKSDVAFERASNLVLSPRNEPCDLGGTSNLELSLSPTNVLGSKPISFAPASGINLSPSYDYADPQRQILSDELVISSSIILCCHC
ncbi:hypothetical protein AX16_002098 [Volvariella volvacea WC 439]|nr:hypothetical protein AX16_002098 [Volvariella volvacea WC 439]